MRQLILNIKDESKLDILINLLKKLDFIEIEGEQKEGNIKKWQGMPDMFLNPILIEDFKMYNREELYER